MGPSPIEPLSEIPTAPKVAQLPKADLHVHQEWFARLDRVLARREGRAPYDWRGWARRLMDEVPPGMPRLRRLATVRPVAREQDAEPQKPEGAKMRLASPSGIMGASERTYRVRRVPQ
jgi:hypothetical protein